MPLRERVYVKEEVLSDSYDDNTVFPFGKYVNCHNFNNPCVKS